MRVNAFNARIDICRLDYASYNVLQNMYQIKKVGSVSPVQTIWIIASNVNLGRNAHYAERIISLIQQHFFAKDAIYRAGSVKDLYLSLCAYLVFLNPSF